MKQKRHSRILKIIKDEDVKTQEQLTDLLKKEDFDVTQATVSRDIKELGIVKVPSSGGGYKYAFANRAKTESSQHLNIFAKAVTNIDYALHTIVIRTYSGMAQAVAASLDAIIGQEILGSIAGDDTIFIITENPEEAQKLTKKLERLFRGKAR